MASPLYPASHLTSLVSVVSPELGRVAPLSLCATFNAPHDAAARQQHSSQRQRKSCEGTRDMAAISRWSGPMRHAKGGAQDGRARHVDCKEYGGWLAAVLGCPTRDLRELGWVCDISEPYGL